jgi:type I restriction enzyme R subunit
VLFVNGIPLVVVEAKIGDANTANPMHAAFEQLLRYRNGRPETTAPPGLREGEPRLFHTNLLLISDLRRESELGTITSGTSTSTPGRTSGRSESRATRRRSGVEREQERLIQGLLAPETLLDVLAHLHGVHGHGLRQAREGGVPLSAIPRRLPHRRRLRSREDAGERSGVVWHTQGSGKSLTMVFVARMLRASADLADFKIVLVNDRVDSGRAARRDGQGSSAAR